jgi:hypothetical protein
MKRKHVYCTNTSFSYNPLEVQIRLPRLTKLAAACLAACQASTFSEAQRIFDTVHQMPKSSETADWLHYLPLLNVLWQHPNEELVKQCAQQLFLPDARGCTPWLFPGSCAPMPCTLKQFKEYFAGSQPLTWVLAQDTTTKKRYVLHVVDDCLQTAVLVTHSWQKKDAPYSAGDPVVIHGKRLHIGTSSVLVIVAVGAISNGSIDPSVGMVNSGAHNLEMDSTLEKHGGSTNLLRSRGSSAVANITVLQHAREMPSLSSASFGGTPSRTSVS